jgi:hypothetical protein
MPPAVEVLGVAESLYAGKMHTRKLIDRYYAGRKVEERDTGWGTMQWEIPDVPGSKGVRFTVAPVPKVSSKTSV